jgi:hypothetical protein
MMNRRERIEVFFAIGLLICAVGAAYQRGLDAPAPWALLILARLMVPRRREG